MPTDGGFLTAAAFEAGEVLRRARDSARRARSGAPAAARKMGTVAIGESPEHRVDSPRGARADRLVSSPT